MGGLSVPLQNIRYQGSTARIEQFDTALQVKMLQATDRCIADRSADWRATCGGFVQSPCLPLLFLYWNAT